MTAADGVWDAADTPVLLAGANGNVYETRPTRSLARDLAYDQDATPLKAFGAAGKSPDASRRPLHQQDTGTSHSRQNRRAATAPTLPALSSHIDPVDLPAAGKSTSSSVRRAPDERPIASVGWAGGLAASPEMRRSRTSTSGGSPQTASPPNWDARSPKANARQAIVPRQAEAVPRPPARAYEPVYSLINRGFDEEASRVAMALTGGNVDKALQLLIEDNKAHVAKHQSEWEFEGDTGWAAFDGEAEALLQDASASGMTSCEMCIHGRRYLIDFDSMTQFNLATSKSRRIRRKRLALEDASAT
mmetsp:Transcript_63151/g.150570  ORF Transcript_63151/g.150570 Transcript_63151/m.150570 type:complete len:303 (+) Transcript_63151:115-1023(+)